MHIQIAEATTVMYQVSYMPQLTRGKKQLVTPSLFPSLVWQWGTAEVFSALLQLATITSKCLYGSFEVNNGEQAV